MITSKSRYALKIMLDLALHQSSGDVQRRSDLARRQSIPSDYMDHILASLRAHGLIESIRGRNGGLKLQQDPAAISVWDIFDAVESNMTPVACLDGPQLCSIHLQCISKDAWQQIFGAIRQQLAQICLKDLLPQSPGAADAMRHSLSLSKEVISPAAFTKAPECRAPRRGAEV